MIKKIKVKITIEDVVDNVLDMLDGDMNDLRDEMHLNIPLGAHFEKDYNPVLGAGFSLKPVYKPGSSMEQVVWIDADKAFMSWLEALLNEALE